MAKASNPAPKKQPTPPKPPAAPSDKVPDPTAAAPDAPLESSSDPAPETTQEQAGAGGVNGLRITAKQDGFRRANRAWSRQPTEVLLGDLGEAEVAMLRAETTMLTVEEVVIKESALP